MIEDRPVIGKARVVDLERQLEDERQAHLVCIEMRNDAEAERDRLRNGIKNYLDGGPEPKVGKMDKCPHGLYGYEDCVNCIDAHFQKLLDEQIKRTE